MTQRLKKFIQQHSLLIDEPDLYKLFQLANDQLSYEECCCLHSILADMSNDDNDPDLDPFPHELELVKEKLTEVIVAYLTKPDYKQWKNSARVDELLMLEFGKDTISSFCMDDFCDILDDDEFLKTSSMLTNRVHITSTGMINRIK